MTALSKVLHENLRYIYKKELEFVSYISLLYFSNTNWFSLYNLVRLFQLLKFFKNLLRKFLVLIVIFNGSL